MPRKPRIEYEDAIYHVMNRGNYREDVFLVEGSGAVFEKTNEDLITEGKCREWKVVLASWIKSQCGVSNQWLSDHLHMGSLYTVSRVVAQENRRHKGRSTVWRKLLTAKR